MQEARKIQDTWIQGRRTVVGSPCCCAGSDDAPVQEAQRIVGNRVRTYRIRAGMTQQHLADVVGTSKSRLSEIECGKHNLSLRQIGKIAGALHVSLEELFEGL